MIVEQAIQSERYKNALSICCIYTARYGSVDYNNAMASLIIINIVYISVVILYRMCIYIYTYMNV